VRAPLVVATDLDGCLLDERSHCYDAAAPALAALRAHGATLVLCSTRTLAEMRPFTHLLGPAAPLIVENGGALLIPATHLPQPPPGARREEAGWLVELGVDGAVLAVALEQIAAETRAGIRRLARCTDAELQRLTALPPAAVGLARECRYNDPFVLDDPAAFPAVAAAAGRRGLRVVRGASCHHLTGPTDKGRAFRLLRTLYESAGRPLSSVGLGDGEDDLMLLREVGRPILVPAGDGVNPSLAAALPRAELAPYPGPPGWNAAVLAVLAGKRLPGVARAAGGRRP